MSPQNKIRQKNKRKGVLIPFVLVSGGVLSLILVGLLSYISLRYEISLRQTSKSKALQAAEAGLSYYHWYIIHTLEGKSAAQIEAYWDGSPLGVPFFENQISDSGGETTLGYRIEVTPPDVGSMIIMVKITGWDTKRPNLTRTLEARLRKPSWSEYSVIANDIMRFGTGTETWGPIHSNNGVHYDGVAHNLITSSIVNTYWDPDYGRWKPGVWTALGDESLVFLAGKDYPVPSKDFNKITVDFSKMKEESQPANGGLYLSDPGGTNCGRHLTLSALGTVMVSRVSSCSFDTYEIFDETDFQNYSLPANGLIFAESNLWVDGTINNKHMTVVAAKLSGGSLANIYINNDILYSNHDGKDVLGLIAQNNVTIGLKSEDQLTVEAALVAQTGRVGRDYYTYTDDPSYYVRDTITVNGAIATNRRYGFAWVCGGTHCSGYTNRNIIYDNNLLYYPPPFFPTGDHYSIDLWEEEQ